MTGRPNRQSKSAPPAMPDLGPIEHLPTGLLRPYARNARTHNDRQVALIAQSLETFGFNNPIIAEEDGTIIAGHGRWLAAQQLGLATVPVVRVKHLNRKKILAYRLADNRLAELAGWDQEMLILEFGELDSLDLDFSIEITGWSHAEIDVILDPSRYAAPHSACKFCDRCRA
ncbi:MAG: ParB/Srx family N-terminal domain-containing protein [Pseudomonadota bacterium]|nr:ParB/Srx family N-terminal domain-containing protein [Pseudomonadota bacterium]